MINWQNTLIRCSSLGKLLTEPVSKEDKLAGNLSKTAKTHLIEIYIREKYGRVKDITTKQMTKGIVQEDESITLLSRYQKKFLLKNEERLSNEYITGLPDIYEGESIHNAVSITDIKSSYDLWTFLNNIPDKLDSNYFYQLQGYMWLSNAQQATIAYCLVDLPDNMLQDEKYRLLKRLDCISEESPEYIKECEKLTKNLTFQDIPLEDKVLLFHVPRNEEDIQKIQQKVIKAREYLQEFEEKHLTFNQ